MRRILLLSQKVIAERCIPILCKPENSESLEVKAVCTTDEFFGKMSEYFPNKPVFISNEQRNEEILLKVIEDAGINMLISIQHPWILSGKVIEAVDGFAFNLHNAKIPDYKGHNTISHAILNGEKQYTTTIHWLAPRVDMGDIAFEESVPITADDTSISLYQKSVDASVQNFSTFMDHLLNGTDIPRKPINSDGTFYGSSSIQALKEIKSVDDYEEVDRKSRAFYFPPFEPAYFVLNGEKFYVSRKPY